MASIARDPNGRRRILFAAPDGRRKTIRLGKVPQKTAESVKARVEALLAAARAGHALDSETAAWLRSRDTVMYGKLVAAGQSNAP